MRLAAAAIGAHGHHGQHDKGDNKRSGLDQNLHRKTLDHAAYASLKKRSLRPHRPTSLCRGVCQRAHPASSCLARGGISQRLGKGVTLAAAPALLHESIRCAPAAYILPLGRIIARRLRLPVIVELAHHNLMRFCLDRIIRRRPAAETFPEGRPRQQDDQQRDDENEDDRSHGCLFPLQRAALEAGLGPRR